MGYKERLQASIDELEEQLNDMDLIEAVIRTLPDKHTDIMLFNSVEEMNACTYAENGTVGVVYYSSQRNVEETDTFQQVTFPETVILPEAYTGYSSFEIRSVDQSVYLSGYCDFNSSRFGIDMWGDTGSYRIQYTSSDGVTYTRTTFEGPNGALTNPVDFGTELQFEIWDEWSDSIGFFMLVGGVALDGIYQYDGSSFNIYTAQLDSTTEDVLDADFYGNNGVMHGTLHQVTNLNPEQIKLRRNIRNMYNNLSVGENGIVGFFAENNSIVQFSAQEQFANEGIDVTNAKSVSKLLYGCRNLTIVNDFVDTTNIVNYAETFSRCVKLQNAIELNSSAIINTSKMYEYCSNITNFSACENYKYAENADMQLMFVNCTNMTVAPNIKFNNPKYVGSMFYNCNNITTFPDFDTSSCTNMASFYRGCNSVNNDIVSRLDVSNAEDISYLLQYCNNVTSISGLSTSNVKYANGAFTNTKITSFPNIDVSNMVYVVSMCANTPITTVENLSFPSAKNVSELFMSCTNLISVNNVQLNSAINCAGLFAACYNLIAVNVNIDVTKIEDGSRMFASTGISTYPLQNCNFTNMTNCYGMFTACRNLAQLPDINICNCIDMQSMFYGCSNLRYINIVNSDSLIGQFPNFLECTSLLVAPNLNTDNITFMSYSFRTCTNLVTVPQYNSAKMTGLQQAFLGCNNLSNASIQNIINMCLNSNVPPQYRNVSNANSYSPLGGTKFSSAYYSNRLAELSQAGWAY